MSITRFKAQKGPFGPLVHSALGTHTLCSGTRQVPAHCLSNRTNNPIFGSNRKEKAGGFPQGDGRGGCDARSTRVSPGGRARDPVPRLAWLPAHPSRRELPRRRLEVSGDTRWGCLRTETLTGAIERLPGIVPGDTDHSRAWQRAGAAGEALVSGPDTASCLLEASGGAQPETSVSNVGKLRSGGGREVFWSCWWRLRRRTQRP